MNGWEPITDFAFGDLGNKSIHELCAWGDHLYAGTPNHNGFQLWRSRCEGEAPYAWERVLQQGAHCGPLNQGVLSMAVFKNSLYVASGIQGGGIDKANKIGPAPAELVRVNEDGSWDLVVDDPRDTPAGWKEPLSRRRAGFDNLISGHFWRMCAHDGWLYMGTVEWSVWLGYLSHGRWPGAFGDLLGMSARRPCSRIPRASTCTEAGTVTTGCPSPPTAWATRTTWACARWNPLPTDCSWARPTRGGRV